MKVKELIEKLQQCDPEKDVWTLNADKHGVGYKDAQVRETISRVYID